MSDNPFKEFTDYETVIHIILCVMQYILFKVFNNLFEKEYQFQNWFLESHGMDIIIHVSS